MPAKATSSGASEFLKLRIIGQDNSEVHFRVKSSVSMEKVKRSYAERAGVPFPWLRFFFKKNLVNDDDTPVSTGMYENCIIRAYLNNTKTAGKTTKSIGSKNGKWTMIVSEKTTTATQKTVTNQTNISENVNAAEPCGVQPSSGAKASFGSEADSEDKSLMVNTTVAVPEAYVDKPAVPEAFSPVNPIKYITLRIVDHHFDEFMFNVMANIPLKKLKNDYAERIGVNVSTLRFFFNACEVTDKDTPTSLKMITEDAIDVFNDY